jgi:AAHS family 4-hydroxybenzoate transporter-like MFS transporter
MAISQTRGGAPPIDVAEFIDRQPVGGFQVRLLLTCAAVLFLDGFDTQRCCSVRLPTASGARRSSF